MDQFSRVHVSRESGGKKSCFFSLFFLSFSCHVSACLVVTVHGRLHARLQVVQGDGLQDVQVVGHLVLDGARTVDDVLEQTEQFHFKLGQQM